MGALTFDALLRSLKQGASDPVYYLHGDEDVLKDEAVRALVERAVDPAARDFNVDQRNAPELDAEAFHALVNTPPMLAATRAVVVRGLDQLKKTAKLRQELLRYLESPNPTTLLVLVQAAGEPAPPRGGATPAGRRGRAAAAGARGALDGAPRPATVPHPGPGGGCAAARRRGQRSRGPGARTRETGGARGRRVAAGDAGGRGGAGRGAPGRNAPGSGRRSTRAAGGGRRAAGRPPARTRGRGGGAPA